MAALLAAVASATTTTVEDTQGKQYYWMWDLIMINIDIFVFYLIGPWYWWAVFFGNPDAFNGWVYEYLNNDFWRLSYLYV
jgi:hypothetical protein